MTKILKYLSISLVALLIVLPSCDRIEDLNDFNEIHTLDIVWSTSETIEMGGVPVEMEIGGVDIVEAPGRVVDTIFIDIAFGETLFPLYFQANPIFRGEIDRIVGVDFSQKQRLLHPDTLRLPEFRDSVLRFYVMAKSGLARGYVILPRIMPLNQNAAIRDFFEILNVEPAMIVSEQGVITGDTLRIFTIGGRGPVTITPRFHTFAETAMFGEITSPRNIIETFSNGEMPLSFNTPEDIHRLRIISESGVEHTWHIMLSHTSLSSSGERTDLSEYVISGSSQTENLVLMSSVTDNTANQILLAVRDLATEEPTEFPLELNLSLNVPSGVQVVSASGSTANTARSANSTRLVFENWDDVETFYMVDTENRESRQWRVNLTEWLSPANAVEAFTFTYTASMVSFRNENDELEVGPAAVVEIDSTEIFLMGASAGHIYLYLSVVNDATVEMPDNWSLALNDVQITQSERATVGQLPNFVWNGNDSWQTPISFEVVAQDGSVRTWYVYGRVRDTSTVAELINLRIENYSPTFVMFEDNPVTIDAENSTVTIALAYDRGAYLPLRIYFAAEVSPRAHIMSQNSGTEPLIFYSDSDTQIISVRAGDRLTTRDWTVRLQHPVRSTEAELLSFDVSNVSGNFVMDSVTRNDVTREIRVWLSSAAPIATPPNVTYTMTVSDWANTSIDLSGTLGFGSFRVGESFTITAEDRTTINDWTVRLIYEPQLLNWNLDTWAGTNVVQGWATANQAAVGTTRIAGNPASGWAAQLQTTSAWGQRASASLFLGSFHFDVDGGLNDPISLTHFGLPFGTSGQILGVQIDVQFTPGSSHTSLGDIELGSVVVELVRPRPGFENAPWRYHGATSGGVFHGSNTGEPVARRQMLFGNSPGTAWNGEPIEVVSPAGHAEWTTVPVLFSAECLARVERYGFTHFHIVFASSAQGDRLNNGAVEGSVLRIDNIRILYREE